MTFRLYLWKLVWGVNMMGSEEEDALAEGDYTK